MTGNQVVWWEIETPDPAGAQRLYGELFGWTFQREFDGPSSELDRDYWIIRAGDRGIGGLQAARAAAPTPQAGVPLYVELTDLEAGIARAVGLGAIVEHERTFLGFRRLLVRQPARPAGHLLRAVDPHTSGREVRIRCRDGGYLTSS